MRKHFNTAGPNIAELHYEIDSLARIDLANLSETLRLPVVLFLDEVDALIGDTLTSLLRQIRTGYSQ